MEIVRIGQTLLRSCPFQSPLLNFRAPSLPHKCSLTARLHSHLIFALPISQRPPNSHQSIRRASSSPSDPIGSSDAKSSNDPPGTQRFTPASVPSDPESSKAPTPIDQLLDRTISSSSRSRHRGSESTRLTSYKTVREGFDQFSAIAGGAQQGEIASSMFKPYDGSANTSVGVSNTVAENLTNHQFHPRRVRTIQSRPSLGRSVEIDSKVDIAKSFTMLKRLVRTQNIKNDQYKQRFYERPGVRRKRLQRERWRARFKKTFRNAVERIKAMRRMGW